MTMMNEQTWIYDERPWPDGPWMSEPDKVQWTDPMTGLPCLAVRHPDNGHWCGYVGVNPGHPLHGHKYTEIDDVIDVHGGLTYSDECEPSEEPGRGVCHVPGPGEPDHVWWFGFDCMHYNDVSPGFEQRMKDVNERMREMIDSDFIPLTTHPSFRAWYKPLEYVQVNCVGLARQLAELGAL